MLVYQIITNDKYELPVFQADTILEIAQEIGRRPESVANSIRSGSEVMQKKFRIIKVEIDMEDDE